MSYWFTSIITLATVQALKKTATKGDKKKKKEVQDEIAKLEKELLEKHALEIKQLEEAMEKNQVSFHVSFVLDTREMRCTPPPIISPMIQVLFLVLTLDSDPFSSVCPLWPTPFKNYW